MKTKKSIIFVSILVSFLFLSGFKEKVGEALNLKREITGLDSKIKNLKAQLLKFQKLAGEDLTVPSPEETVKEIYEKSFLYNCSFSYSNKKRRDGSLIYLQGTLTCNIPSFYLTEEIRKKLFSGLPVSVEELLYRPGRVTMKVRIYGRK